MEANTRNRTLALAALFQCIEGVNQIASRGQSDAALMKSCMHSLLTEHADTIEDLYGSVTDLKTGLGILLHQLGTGTLMPDGKPKNMDTTRYAVNILYLEKKLQQDPAMFRALLQGIEMAQQQLEFFSIDHPNMIARLAELYTQTISKLGPRIIIKGDQQHLANTDNAAKIRVFLLGGIRAALLWRQAGGNRWRLLFSRGTMQNEARQLLKA